MSAATRSPPMPVATRRSACSCLACRANRSSPRRRRVPSGTSEFSQCRAALVPTVSISGVVTRGTGPGATPLANVGVTLGGAGQRGHRDRRVGCLHLPGADAGGQLHRDAVACRLRHRAGVDRAVQRGERPGRQFLRDAALHDQRAGARPERHRRQRRDDDARWLEQRDAVHRRRRPLQLHRARGRQLHHHALARQLRVRPGDRRRSRTCKRTRSRRSSSRRWASSRGTSPRAPRAASSTRASPC